MIGTLAVELARAEASIADQDPLLLLPAEGFLHDECGRVPVFRGGDQGRRDFWGVHLRDLAQDDPTVLVRRGTAA
ncbi:hypothetical protein GCM10010277_61030 [Streptomyces longisporoflavus]|nr:hypothetical protein GCM10010277_61030 [Streptomyces longisporoflavus]